MSPGPGASGLGGEPFGPEVSAARRRAPESTLRDWLALAHAAADEADAIALAHFRRDIVVSRKPDRSFVTAADEAVERAIRSRIGTAYPAHGLVGEEYGEAAGTAAVRWYVDPIDGTHSYMRGIPVFATLLAVEAEGELQLGLMSAPALGQRWWAARGLGAWTRDRGGERRISVSAIGELGDAQLFYASGRSAASSGLMPGFDALIADAWRDRGFGDFWGYALVAEGTGEAMIETGVSPYDIAAPLVIVEEAGGRATDIGGGRSFAGISFVATNGTLHEAILGRLRG